jgi:WhiB family redox-sensing transcriptional regulator
MSDWRHRAACRPGNLDAGDLGEEIFFPIGSTGPSLLWIEDAKAICRTCPKDVVEQCLEYALDHNSDGVWGATSEEERRSMKRRAARARSRMA